MAGKKLSVPVRSCIATDRDQRFFSSKFDFYEDTGKEFLL